MKTPHTKKFKKKSREATTEIGVRAEHRFRLLVTAEHASNRVPASLQKKIKIPNSILETHRGWDPGTLDVAQKISKHLDAPLLAGDCSRLVFDLNRSPENPEVFSTWATKNLSDADRLQLLKQHQKFWHAAANQIDRLLRTTNSVLLHLSMHSFTPILRGVHRSTGIGILFDPEHKNESHLARQLIRILLKNAHKHSCQRLIVEENKPYLGTADALTTALRKRFAKDPDGARYCGIEIEINQRLIRGSHPSKRWSSVQNWIVSAIRELIADQW